jgi:hypothetical protein
MKNKKSSKWAKHTHYQQLHITDPVEGVNIYDIFLFLTVRDS